MRFINQCLLSYLFLFIISSGFVSAQYSYDFEVGVVKTGYNKVRIPGNTGTFVSLSHELKQSTTNYLRIFSTYNLNSRSSISILIAPLKLNYTGELSRDVFFYNQNFAQGASVTSTYKFNSYRVSYSYLIFKKQKFSFSAGLTLKVRDAFIRLESGSVSSTKYDLGVVPLINFNFTYSPFNRVGFIFYGDALAAPQGRAEDFFVGLTYSVYDKLGIKAGYRMLEGGADNKTVYTFSLFHYYAIGILFNL
jgi:hypothetical protein